MDSQDGDVRPDEELDAPDESLQLFYDGGESLKAGDLARALALLSRSWEIRPHAKTAYLISRVHVLRGDAERARDWAHRSYVENPRHNQIAVHFAEVLRAAGDLATAEQIARQVLARSGDYAPARKVLAGLGLS